MISSPDQVLWAYLELRQRLGSPTARDAVIDRGLVFGDFCSNAACKAPKELAKLEERDPKSKASRWICSECAAAWPVDLAFLLRNEFQSSPRGDAGADLYAQMATYGTMLSRLPLREQRIYLLLYLYEGVGAYRDVADAANRRFPRTAPPHGQRGPRQNHWTEWTVRRCITAARRRLNDQLRIA